MLPYGQQRGGGGGPKEILEKFKKCMPRLDHFKLSENCRKPFLSSKQSVWTDKKQFRKIQGAPHPTAWLKEDNRMKGEGGGGIGEKCQIFS